MASEPPLRLPFSPSGGTIIAEGSCQLPPATSTSPFPPPKQPNGQRWGNNRRMMGVQEEAALYLSKAQGWEELSPEWLTSSWVLT